MNTANEALTEVLPPTRVSKDIKVLLNKIAKEKDRSVAFLIRQAISKFYADYGGQKVNKGGSDG